MGMLADAAHEIVIANTRLGGSLRHQEHRRVLVTSFLRYARQQRALTRSLADVPAWLVHMYAGHCITQGMGPGPWPMSFLLSVWFSARWETTLHANAATVSLACHVGSESAHGVPRHRPKLPRCATAPAGLMRG
ncbi:hypothetical protein LMG28727_03738 [Paraburkholderia kirstenboschensis]|nr:hypothetical protein LMG28727_03738 [Paraburkholderia kirstenboschensis]